MADVDQSLLGTFQKHIEDMRNLSLCKICIKPFYEPFILGCGHTYCYSCLASWFGGAQGRRKNRNCPDCRAVVTVQPSPNYLLRDLVHMFIGRAELMPEDETIAEHQLAREEEAGLLAADRAGPGLFKGVFLRRPHPVYRLGHGVLDQEDNVVRCPECHWELQDGECLQCGFREFEAGGDTESDSEEDDDSDILSLQTIETEYDEGGNPIPHHYATAAALHRALHHPYTGFYDVGRSVSESDPDEADDYDEDDDMDGFIDDELEEIDDDDEEDDGEGSQTTMTNFHVSADNRRHYSRHDEPRDESDLHVTNYDQQSDVATNYDEQSDIATNYDEQTEPSESEFNTEPVQRYQSRRSRIIISDDEDDQNEESSSESGDESEDGQTTQGSEDGEDDEDDHDTSESTTDQGDTEQGGSGSEESDDTAIRAPQSFARRRQHLQSMRARRHSPALQSHSRSNSIQHQHHGTFLRHRGNQQSGNTRLYGSAKRWDGTNNSAIARGVHGF